MYKGDGIRREFNTGITKKKKTDEEYLNHTTQ